MMRPPSALALRALRSLTSGAIHTSHKPTCLAAANRSRQTFPAIRPLTTTPTALSPPPPSSSSPPRTHNRGPKSSETTQTDFSALNVLGDTTPPSTAIDACLPDGFHLDNGVKISDGSGLMLVAGEAFAWRPWETGSEIRAKEGMINAKGQWEAEGAWGVLEVVWPKPDLLILGLGAGMHPLSPETKKEINGMGIRVEIQDTRNAAAQFNLLATERGVGNVAAALIPVGWRGR